MPEYDAGAIVGRLELDSTPFMSALAEAQGSVRDATGQMSSAFGQTQAMAVTAANALEGLGQRGVTYLKGAVGLASQFQMAQFAFTSMLGSGEKARKLLEDLEAFSLRTPFDYQQLVEGTRRLMAYGFAARDLIPTLQTIANATAAMGGGSEMIDRVVRALGQIKGKGRLMAQEMNQLTENGIPAWEILAEKLGVDIPKAMDMVTKKQVSSGVAIEGFMEGINRRFGGMIEGQSKTLGGRMSNVRDAAHAVARTLGEQFLPLMSRVTDAQFGFLEGLKQVDPMMVAAGSSIALVVGKLAGMYMQYIQLQANWTIINRLQDDSITRYGAESAAIDENTQAKQRNAAASQAQAQAGAQGQLRPLVDAPLQQVSRAAVMVPGIDQRAVQVSAGAARTVPAFAAVDTAALETGLVNARGALASMDEEMTAVVDAREGWRDYVRGLKKSMRGQAKQVERLRTWGWDNPENVPIHRSYTPAETTQIQGILGGARDRGGLATDEELRTLRGMELRYERAHLQRLLRSEPDLDKVVEQGGARARAANAFAQYEKTKKEYEEGVADLRGRHAEVGPQQARVASARADAEDMAAEAERRRLEIRQRVTPQQMTGGAAWKWAEQEVASEATVKQRLLDADKARGVAINGAADAERTLQAATDARVAAQKAVITTNTAESRALLADTVAKEENARASLDAARATQAEAEARVQNTTRMYNEQIALTETAYASVDAAEVRDATAGRKLRRGADVTPFSTPLDVGKTAPEVEQNLRQNIRGYNDTTVAVERNAASVQRWTKELDTARTAERALTAEHDALGRALTGAEAHAATLASRRVQRAQAGLGEVTQDTATLAARQGSYAVAAERGQNRLRDFGRPMDKVPRYAGQAEMEASTVYEAAAQYRRGAEGFQRGNLAVAEAVKVRRVLEGQMSDAVRQGTRVREQLIMMEADALLRGEGRATGALGKFTEGVTRARRAGLEKQLAFWDGHSKALEGRVATVTQKLARAEGDVVRHATTMERAMAGIEGRAPRVPVPGVVAPTPVALPTRPPVPPQGPPAAGVAGVAGTQAVAAGVREVGVAARQSSGWVQQLGAGMEQAFSLIINPMTIALGLLAAVGAVLFQLYQRDEAFRTQVNDTWAQLRTAFAAVAEVVASVAQAFGGVLATALGVVTGVIRGLMTALLPLLRAFSAVLKFVLDSPLGQMAVYFGLAALAVSALTRAIASYLVTQGAMVLEQSAEVLANEALAASALTVGEAQVAAAAAQVAALQTVIVMQGEVALASEASAAAQIAAMEAVAGANATIAVAQGSLTAARGALSGGAGSAAGAAAGAAGGTALGAAVAGKVAGNIASPLKVLWATLTADIKVIGVRLLGFFQTVIPRIAGFVTGLTAGVGGLITVLAAAIVMGNMLADAKKKEAEASLDLAAAYKHEADRLEATKKRATSAQEDLGFTPEQALGEDFLKRLSPERQKVAQEVFAAAKARGGATEEDVKRMEDIGVHFGTQEIEKYADEKNRVLRGMGVTDATLFIAVKVANWDEVKSQLADIDEEIASLTKRQAAIKLKLFTQVVPSKQREELEKEAAGISEELQKAAEVRDNILAARPDLAPATAPPVDAKEAAKLVEETRKGTGKANEAAGARAMEAASVAEEIRRVKASTDEGDVASRNTTLARLRGQKDLLDAEEEYQRAVAATYENEVAELEVAKKGTLSAQARARAEDDARVAAAAAGLDAEKTAVAVADAVTKATEVAKAGMTKETATAIRADGDRAREMLDVVMERKRMAHRLDMENIERAARRADELDRARRAKELEFYQWQTVGQATLAARAMATAGDIARAHARLAEGAPLTERVQAAARERAVMEDERYARLKAKRQIDFSQRTAMLLDSNQKARLQAEFQADETMRDAKHKEGLDRITETGRAQSAAMERRLELDRAYLTLQRAREDAADSRAQRRVQTKSQYQRALIDVQADMIGGPAADQMRAMATLQEAQLQRTMKERDAVKQYRREYADLQEGYTRAQGGTYATWLPDVQARFVAETNAIAETFRETMGGVEDEFLSTHLMVKLELDKAALAGWREQIQTAANAPLMNNPEFKRGMEVMAKSLARLVGKDGVLGVTAEQLFQQVTARPGAWLGLPGQRKMEADNLRKTVTGEGTTLAALTPPTTASTAAYKPPVVTPPPTAPAVVPPPVAPVVPVPVASNWATALREGIVAAIAALGTGLQTSLAGIGKTNTDGVEILRGLRDLLVAAIPVAEGVAPTGVAMTAPTIDLRVPQLTVAPVGGEVRILIMEDTGFAARVESIAEGRIRVDRVQRGVDVRSGFARVV